MALTQHDLQEGERIIFHHKLKCLHRGVGYVVRLGAFGKYVNCAEGKHYLSANEDEDGFLVGVSRAVNDHKNDF